MTRCSAFNRPESLTVDESLTLYEHYIASSDDPTIFFHVSGGAKVQRIAQNYRPEDVKNLGSAVLIKYDVAINTASLLASDNSVRAQSNSIKVDDNKVTIVMGKILAEIAELIEEEFQPSFEDLCRVPLMNILDSMGMQQLRSRIQDILGRDLPLSFLFQHPTLECVREFIACEGKFPAQYGTHMLLLLTYIHNC